MPTFKPEHLDIDVDEFLSYCSSSEIEEIIDTLIKDGQINKNARIGIGPYSTSEAEFQEALNKLHGKWNMITQIEEHAIIKTSSRF